MTPYSLADYYATSLVTGLRSLPTASYREAAARILNPLSYPRFREFDLALRPLLPLAGKRVLDVGSPKLPVLLIARRERCELYATDIRSYFVASLRQFLRRNGQGQRLDRDLHLEAQDARHLTYPDAFFDAIYSISVIEHIPDDGDGDAMRELARVLRPGGLLSLTVPFSAAGYDEEFVKGDVYERAGDGGLTFYQRYYDREALQHRLVEPSGLTLVSETFFGEPGLQFERYWNRVPMKWKVPLLWAQPFLAELLFRPLAPHQLARARGAAVLLRKDAA